MLLIAQKTAFKKDIKKLKKQNKDLNKLSDVVEILAKQIDLPLEYLDHPLKGTKPKMRDCHIEPDWLLLYGLEDDLLILYRTSSHSDLFK
ncbi:MAG: type II toxin-antitoxin system YafQ family toxin [Alphaproteobacteria bacterium]